MMQKVKQQQDEEQEDGRSVDWAADINNDPLECGYDRFLQIMRGRYYDWEDFETWRQIPLSQRPPWQQYKATMATIRTM